MMSTDPDDRPLVSIVIPTLNRKDRLVRAIESVRRQDVPGRLEIVVVDNACDDGTTELLDGADYDDVRHIHQATRVSRVENFTAAFLAATGRYVGILYDDEEMLAGNLQRKIELMEQHPEVIAVTSSVTKRDFAGDFAPGRLMRPDVVIEDRITYLRNTFRTTPGGLPPFLMRRHAVEQIRIEARDDPLDDNAFSLRLSTLGSIATLPEGFVTDTVTDAEMMRNGLLEPFAVPRRPGVTVPLPGIWFYWCEQQIWLEHLIKSNDLTQRELRSLRRLARRKYREGVWKAAYYRLRIARRVGPSAAVLRRAIALDPVVVLPPVVSFVRLMTKDASAPIPPRVIDRDWSGGAP
jgi:glycosyltransferase involved in cell wall biosynthesis